MSKMAKMLRAEEVEDAKVAKMTGGYGLIKHTTKQTH